MRLLVIMAAALAAGIAHGSEPAGVYGYVQKVVLESANGQPQRMQIWGTFCVAAPAPSDAYQEPESGYLYVEMPADPAATLREYNDLRNTFGKIGVVAFSGREASKRVRTSDEKPDRPDRYSFGNGVALLSFGTDSPPVRKLGQLTKERLPVAYAVVDKVVVLSSADAAPSIQIWGLFALGSAKDSSYTEVRAGYLSVASPNDPATLDALQKVAVTSEVVRLDFARNSEIRLRPPGETPNASTVYIIRRLVPIRSDTPYAPVQALLTSRRP
jgi:hypothetical protein